MNGAAYMADAIKRFQEAQAQAERALDQVPFEFWGHRLDPESNSLTTLMLHLSGNLRSRWTDFLQSDGEKPDRDRDSEFEDPATLTEQALRALAPTQMERVPISLEDAFISYLGERGEKSFILSETEAQS